MAKKNDAKRAAKKHAKEKKRAKKIEKRREFGDARADVLARWKPRTQGIEGLARLLKTGSHDASVLAETLATNHGRTDAALAWLPSRVRALSTESLLAELAKRGVVTNEAAFLALTAGHTSARRLAADHWGPLLSADADVHDRDLVGEAAEVLWERWAPALPTDEQLLDATRDTEDALDNEDDDALEQLEALFERALGHGGVPRLEAVGAEVGDLARGYARTLVYVSERDPERGLALLESLRATAPVGGRSWNGLSASIATVCGAEGGPVAAYESLLGSIALDPTNADLLDRVGVLVLNWDGETDARAPRVSEALAYGLTLAEGKRREELEKVAESFNQAVVLLRAEREATAIPILER
jgi:hypothetical protein